MAGRDPEDAPPPLVRQGWRDVTFVHWPVPVDDLRPLVPRPLDLDTFDGTAWVTLTPFRVVGLRALGVVPVPGANEFGECNLRTYVTGPDGRDGLWFLTLEAASPPTVAAARLGYGVPYRRADVRVTNEGGALVSRSRRVGAPDVGVDLAVRLGPDLAGDELDHWLTGRWRAYGTVGGRVLTRVSVRHQPWPLQAAEIQRLDDTLSPAVGLPPPGAPVRVHAAAGVDVVLGPPVPVGVC